MLPGVGVWHTSELLPRDGAGWCASAADSAAGAQLAPLAHAALTLEPDGGGGVASARLEVLDPAVAAAAALTPSEEGLVGHWSMACRAARGDDGAWVDGGGWEGSAEWLRQQIHEYFWAVARAAARQVLAGSAAELQQQHGVAWVGRWAATRSFAGWAARNGLQAACRLWRVRLDASTAEAEAEAAAAAAAAAAQPTAAERARQVGGRLTGWFKQKVGRDQAAPQ